MRKRRGRPPTFKPKLNLGQRIHCLRLAIGYTQIQFADLIKSSQGTISKLENGTLEPTLFFLYQLRLTFKISIDSIIDDNIDFVSIAHNHHNYNFDFEKVCGKLGIPPSEPSETPTQSI